MTDTIWQPDDAAAIPKLRDAMERLSEYRNGMFPRPDLDTALEDADDAWTRVDALLTRLERDSVLPETWWVHLGGDVCTSEVSQELPGIGICEDHDQRVNLVYSKDGRPAR